MTSPRGHASKKRVVFVETPEEVQNSETAVILWCCVPEQSDWVRVGIEPTPAEAEETAHEAHCHWGDRTAIVPLHGGAEATAVVGGFYSPNDYAQAINAGRVAVNA